LGVVVLLVIFSSLVLPGYPMTSVEPHPSSSEAACEAYAVTVFVGVPKPYKF
jgi:hypothetical protein